MAPLKKKKKPTDGLKERRSEERKNKKPTDG
jgi:hypothetical protein